jgi:hypothetical protein
MIEAAISRSFSFLTAVISSSMGGSIQTNCSSPHPSVDNKRSAKEIWTIASPSRLGVCHLTARCLYARSSLSLFLRFIKELNKVASQGTLGHRAVFLLERPLGPFEAVSSTKFVKRKRRLPTTWLQKRNVYILTRVVCA